MKTLNWADFTRNIFVAASSRAIWCVAEARCELSPLFMSKTSKFIFVNEGTPAIWVVLLELQSLQSSDWAMCGNRLLTEQYLDDLTNSLNAHETSTRKLQTNSETDELASSMWMRSYSQFSTLATEKKCQLRAIPETTTESSHMHDNISSAGVPQSSRGRQKWAPIELGEWYSGDKIASTQMQETIMT